MGTIYLPQRRRLLTKGTSEESPIRSARQGLLDLVKRAQHLGQSSGP